MAERWQRYARLIAHLERFVCWPGVVAGETADWRSLDEIKTAVSWIEQLEECQEGEAETNRSLRRRAKAPVVKLVPPP
jgi:hypothetical protein